jgi:hypothetical protein
MTRVDGCRQRTDAKDDGQAEKQLVREVSLCLCRAAHAQRPIAAHGRRDHHHHFE